MLPIWVMAFGLVATVLLLFGQLTSLYVGLLGGAAVLATTIVIGQYVWSNPDKKLSKERVAWNVIVLLGMVVWGVFNMSFVAQHVITDRDPGVYANAGAWLINHRSLGVNVPSVLGSGNGLIMNSPGFAVHSLGGHTSLYPQGLHLLPIYLGLAGRIFGLGAIFHVNVLFGISALLAIYAVVRALVKPVWAAAVTGALASSMPFIYFSRDTYTEPLAATFTFGALAVLYMALKSRRLSLWLLAGLLAGAGTLTRVDGFLVIAGFAAFLAVQLLLSKESDRRSVVGRSGMLAAGMSLAGLVGWLDLSRLSAPYYNSTRTQFFEEVLLLVGIVVTGLLLISLAWHTKLLQWADQRTKQWRSTAAVLLVLFIALVLASRPLWLRSHGSNGARNYAELSTEWISWYLGPLLALVGVTGIALTASRIVKRYHPLLTAIFLVFFITAGVYLINPNISPDQIWASRRLVPVILPGVALFAALALDALWRGYFRRVAWPGLYIAIAVLAIILGPLITSRPLLLEHDTNLLAPLENMCDSLPPHAAIVWIGTAATFLVQPTRTMCGVPAVGYGKFYTQVSPPSATLALVAQHARSNGYETLVGVYGSQSDLLGAGQGNLTTVSPYAYTKLDAPIINAPQGTMLISDSLKLGIIEPDGSIVPLRK